MRREAENDPAAGAAATALFQEFSGEPIEHTAVDLAPETGCLACPLGRDYLSGWGRLDVTAAIESLDEHLPLRDAFEANDDAGSRAFDLSGDARDRDRRIKATVDFWDDQDDVYAIKLRKNQRVYIGLTGDDASDDLNLALWSPSTRSIDDVRSARRRVRVSARPGAREYFSYRAPKAGRYFVQVRMSSPGAVRYRLAIVKS